MTKILVWCGIAFILLMTGTGAIVLAITDFSKRVLHGVKAVVTSGFMTPSVGKK